MFQCFPRCSTSNGLIRFFHTYTSRRCYAPMFSETTSTVVAKTDESEIQKSKDPTMLQICFFNQDLFCIGCTKCSMEVDIENLPRVQRRHVEEFLKMSEGRAITMKKLSYKNLVTFLALLSLAMGVYAYTFSGLKQETFLEEIDQEVASELTEEKK